VLTGLPSKGAQAAQMTTSLEQTRASRCKGDRIKGSSMASANRKLDRNGHKASMYTAQTSDVRGASGSTSGDRNELVDDAYSIFALGRNIVAVESPAMDNQS